MGLSLFRLDPTMNPALIIAKKRDGLALGPREIADFISGFSQGLVPDYQMAALAMAVYLRGMTADETAALTDAMLASGRLALPGVLTPTEVAAAMRAGVHGVKLFPAGTLGIAHMRALFGPFPGLRVVPTGGITIAGARTWLDAGAVAVGLGGELVPGALRVAGAWGEIARNASLLVERLGAKQQ